MEERDVIIIGGGPAGISAGIFAALDGWNTLLLEGRWKGGQAAIASTVVNYPGFLPGDGANLIENMIQQLSSPPPKGVGAEIREERVIDIDPDKKEIITTKNQYQAKAIVLATGSEMKKLGAKGEDKFIGRGVSYYARRDLEKFANKNVLVVGGGNSTAKSALLAKTVAKKLIMIHRRESLRTYPMMTRRLEKEGLEIWFNTELKEIKGKDKVERVIVVNNKTGEEKELEMDWVVICAGTTPNTELARKIGLKLKGDYIEVDEKLMTSKQGIFACGEVAGCIKHLINCAGQGAEAGMAVSEYLARELVKAGKMFKGAKNGKYADEYLKELNQSS